MTDETKVPDINRELHLVLINEEEQYSLWPSHKKVPYGWKIALDASTKDDCLNYVNEHWLDMRPLSLRKIQEKT